MVKSVDRNGLTLQRGESAGKPHRHLGGGVTAASIGRILAERTQAETDRGGRIVVRPDLSIPGHPDIYVVGDLVLYRDRQGKPLPGVAQVAMQQGTYAAKLNGKSSPPPIRVLR